MSKASHSNIDWNPTRDFVRFYVGFYGAMDVLISDRAKAEISNKVQDILRTFIIGDWQSEPKRQSRGAWWLPAGVTVPVVSPVWFPSVRYSMNYIV